MTYTELREAINVGLHHWKRENQVLTIPDDVKVAVCMNILPRDRETLLGHYMVGFEQIATDIMSSLERIDNGMLALLVTVKVCYELGFGFAAES